MSTETKSSKWDQPGPQSGSNGNSTERTTTSTPTKESETPSSVSKKADAASEAASQAAAIAAKIAAQFSAGALDSGTPNASAEHPFTKDIDINDVRTRYLLTKGSTQQHVNEESGGAVVSTKGTWYPDRAKATEKEPPLFLHVTAPTAEILKKAVDKIEEIMNTELGSLAEDKKREKRKWPEEKLPIGLESIRNFNVRAKVVGPGGSFVKYIQHESTARVQIKGHGSGFIDSETGKEHDEPLFIHITAPEEGQVARAKVLAEDLLLVVRTEHAKQQARLQEEQAALYAAQMQYSAYSGYGMPMAAVPGQSPPAPGSAPPPPPDQPPPPPPGTNGAAIVPNAQPGADQDPMAAYSAYWAAYGYDVSSPQFKEWLTQQYQQYYSQGSAPGSAGGALPPGQELVQPPPPSSPPAQAPPA